MQTAIFGLPHTDKASCGLKPPSPQRPQEKADKASPHAHQHGITVTARQEARRTRHRHIRCHWQHAKRLSQSVTQQDLQGWLIQTGDIANLCPMVTIPALIEVRSSFARTYNHFAVLKINAAIWQELQRWKNRF